MAVSDTKNKLLSGIDDHILGFSASLDISNVSHLQRSHNLSELTALRNDPAVMRSFAQADADLEHIDRIVVSLAEARLRLQMRRARMEAALAAVCFC